MNGQIKHIAIAGGGLVGSLLAIYLQRRGYSTTVFERRPDPRTNTVLAGRSINLALSSRGIAPLEQLGLTDIVKRIAIPMHGRMMHDTEGKLTFQPYGKEGQFINSVSRSDLNVLLMNEAEKAGAEYLFEHRCVNIDPDRNEITWTKNTAAFTPGIAMLENAASLFTRNYDLIVGADGAFSGVRAALQFTDRFNFSQHYIEHGYKELHIPASADGAFQLEPNALHIWPRESFMMIALPNPDRSFTCTLFLPFEGPVSFNQLKTDSDVAGFFGSTFPDALSLMPAIHEDWRRNPTSSLVTMKCFPWVKGNTFLIGDAAHAVVPFYGQGMNAGFEDCRILNQMLDVHHDDWNKTLAEFQATRKPDADAIATLALENFIEMRDLVADADFLLRKKIEAKLHALYPEHWIPQYTMVTFRPDIRYSDAFMTGQIQKKVMDRVMMNPDVESNWEGLDYEAIIRALDEEKKIKP
jgi:kynurenine 3-monooxygenase